MFNVDSQFIVCGGFCDLEGSVVRTGQAVTSLALTSVIIESQIIAVAIRPNPLAASTA